MKNPNPLPVSQCPTCGYAMDHATSLTDGNHNPSPGDLSVCLKCGELLTYTDALTIRQLELADLMKLDGINPELQVKLRRAQALIRRTRPLS